jgi:hypothetical protein
MKQPYNVVARIEVDGLVSKAWSSAAPLAGGIKCTEVVHLDFLIATHNLCCVISACQDVNNFIL